MHALAACANGASMTGMQLRVQVEAGAQATRQVHRRAGAQRATVAPALDDRALYRKSGRAVRPPAAASPRRCAGIAFSRGRT